MPSSSWSKLHPSYSRTAREMCEPFRQVHLCAAGQLTIELELIFARWIKVGMRLGSGACNRAGNPVVHICLLGQTPQRHTYFKLQHSCLKRSNRYIAQVQWSCATWLPCRSSDSGVVLQQGSQGATINPPAYCCMSLGGAAAMSRSGRRYDGSTETLPILSKCDKCLT